MKLRKMSTRIFLNMFIIAIFILSVSVVLTVGVVHHNSSKQNIDVLKNELNCIVVGIDKSGVSYLNSLDLEHRVTLVDNNGKVIFDNKENPDKMENHNKRIEIKEARKSGTGYSERYSNTVSEKTVNVAQKIDNDYVIRLSDSTSTVWSVVIDILLPMAVVLAIAVCIAIYLAYRMSIILTKPINELDLSNPKKEHVYVEMEKLVDKINAQNKLIDLQMETIKSDHEKQDSFRRDFTANVSHELKTPLTSISGFAEIIEQGIVKDEDITRFAHKIHKESLRLITLVGDIIKLSQLEGKGVEVKMEPIDLHETCAGVISHLEDAAEKMGVEVKLNAMHLVINGAEQIIEEMVYNLIDNAIKYNKQGGVVEVSVKKETEGIALSVKDTGIGIPEEDMDRIFERFYRVDKSHSKQIGGTGLGLSIVKHGALYHNAKVSVNSAINEGTTIKIIF